MVSNNQMFVKMDEEGILSRFNAYAQALGMDSDKCLNSLANEWENEREGLYEDISSGVLLNFLDAELEAKGVEMA